MLNGIIIMQFYPTNIFSVENSISLISEALCYQDKSGDVGIYFCKFVEYSQSDYQASITVSVTIIYYCAEKAHISMYLAMWPSRAQWIDR